MARTTEATLLAAARSGEEGAFARLTGPYRRELHVHCYRLVGTPQDADDALQEAMLRAWRQIDGFEGRSSLRTWLYRIATNVCLRALERQPAELLPYPDGLLDVASGAPGPDAAAEARETIELAFLTLLQLLPPTQRAAFVLREALGLPTAAIADLLGTSPQAVNSALQRARATVDGNQQVVRHSPADADEERRLVDEFMRVWADVDIEGLTGLLASDAVMTMPPESIRVDGGAAIGQFFGSVPAGGRLDRFRLVPVRANGQPGLAAYMRDNSSGRHDAYGIMVLTIAGGQIAAITGFPGPAVFETFGLPPSLD
jgi:RNA polymerase sigma-70 factor (ECF subfamily)